MDPIAAAEFANLIGRFYQTLATQVGDYIHEKMGSITKDEFSILSGDQTRLITYSNTFFALSDRIAFDGAEIYFQKVRDAMGQINEALKHIDKVDKVIEISAHVISLAGGIVSKNPAMIKAALSALKEEIPL
jgi:hypothetical protein